MIVYTKKKVERVELIIKDTDRDKNAAHKWLMKNGHVPTDRRPVCKIVLWRLKHKRTYPCGLDDGLKIVPDMFILIAEKLI